MARKKEANRTLMYSIGENGIVIHKLPYDSSDKVGMEVLQRFIKKGYTFEDPMKGITEVSEIRCSECGRECKSEFGLSVHQRIHARGKVVAEVS